MNTQDFPHEIDATENSACRCGTGEARRASLARKMRLISRLMRAEMQKTLRTDTPPTRGEVKAAAEAIENRVTDAVSEEELATTLATLDKIADAFGDRDALPFRPYGRGGRFGSHDRHGLGSHQRGRGRGFGHHNR